MGTLKCPELNVSICFHLSAFLITYEGELAACGNRLIRPSAGAAFPSKKNCKRLIRLTASTAIRFQLYYMDYSVRANAWTTQNDPQLDLPSPGRTGIT